LQQTSVVKSGNGQALKRGALSTDDLLRADTGFDGARVWIGLLKCQLPANRADQSLLVQTKAFTVRGRAFELGDISSAGGDSLLGLVLQRAAVMTSSAGFWV
jgi:hypothetical protein